MNGNNSVSVSGAFDYGQPSVRMETSSELDLEEFALQWKLNVSEGILMSEPLTSPIFVGGVRSQHSWQLKFIPDAQRCIVNVHLLQIGNKAFSENGEEVRAKVFIDYKKPQIQSCLEIQQELKDLKLTGLKPGKPGCISSPLWKRGFGSNLKNYIDNEKQALTIYCRIIVKCGMKHSEIVKTLLPCFESAQSEVVVGTTHHFARTLKALYNSREFSDIIIHTGTMRIMAHKAILAAQSPVFKAMFQTKMLETQNNVIDIKEFSTDVVNAMLEFIYTGAARDFKDPGKVGHLLRISDKYGLVELKVASEQMLCSKLNVKNAAEFFHLATLHNAKTLKVFALRFIQESKLKVGETEFFKKLVKADPDLLLELYLSI